MEPKDIKQDSGDGQLPRVRDEPKETEYDVVVRHRRLRVNSVQILQRTQILRGGRAMMDIPLCRMIGLQVVRPTLAVDIEKLKADFVHGYHLGAAMFYVSITNFVGSEREVLSEDRVLWDRHWQRRDREFEAFLQADPDLRFLSNKFFFVWDGNHRHQAWTEHILQAHSDDLDWHYRIRSIVLRTTNSTTSIITAMQDINKAIENSDVKTNLVHTLHRMRKVGTLEYT